MQGLAYWRLTLISAIFRVDFYFSGENVIFQNPFLAKQYQSPHKFWQVLTKIFFTCNSQYSVIVHHKYKMQLSVNSGKKGSKSKNIILYLLFFLFIWTGSDLESNLQVTQTKILTHGIVADNNNQIEIYLGIQ